jgi:hypothetical protein
MNIGEAMARRLLTDRAVLAQLSERATTSEITPNPTGRPRLNSRRHSRTLFASGGGRIQTQAWKYTASGVLPAPVQERSANKGARPLAAQ